MTDQALTGEGGTSHQDSQTRIDSALELWGGHECTVNRVKDRWSDQTVRTGHQDRLSDLTRFAEIGFKALRYPVLWERISPERPDKHDWRWTDERLEEMRRLGMRPIAGLTHHGSGPHYTNLLDPSFATGLAEHAAAVAERYPWLEAYTPVNEPLTTARFSALYGHWYPHARDEGLFLEALLNQIDATRLSMRAIRAVNPAAQLIQTEDLGHVFATDPLIEQARFENERRWLTWDLLCGRVIGPEHPMWARFASSGLSDRLRAIADDPCPPDVMGVNYYLSSERFLDHRIERYPASVRGGNYADPYCDVEAVRVVAPSVMGLERLLEATWERYGISMAVTESHNGCTRDEQMRWAKEAWDACQRLNARGVPVKAVTIWSLLGSIDWNSLLTKDAGHYEVGVFDVRPAAKGGALRPTAMVEFCRRLAHDEAETHPVLDGQGWWRRDIRFDHAPVWVGDAPPPRRRWSPASREARPILITGATGTLGRAMARACEHRGLAYLLTDRSEFPLRSGEAMGAVLDELRPWAVINTAGWVRVDDAESERDACFAANADGPARLARLAAERDLPLVSYSSDLVFDGAKGSAYVESDAAKPLNVYGESKAAAEHAFAEAGGLGLMLRTSAFFSPFDRHNFAWAVVNALSQGRPFQAASDLHISPTFVPDLVSASLDLLIDGDTGLRHLANGGALTWAEFAIRVADACGQDASLIEGVPHASFHWTAARPAFVPLSTERGEVMPTLDSAIERFAETMRHRVPVRAPVPEAANEQVRLPAKRVREVATEPKSFAQASRRRARVS